MNKKENSKDHRFQVNLGGMIDLLSNHLYSSPRVFVRELLQNAIDAISARKLIDVDFQGRVCIEVLKSSNGVSTLIFEDDGVGLLESEVHEFLATIGESSKRDDLSKTRDTFIGQFGIGLLSCFMVSDEIVIITRSARDENAKTIEWRGRPDGTYQVRELEKDLAPGTKVYLTAKAEYEDLFSADSVEELARHYGGLLPIGLNLQAGGVLRNLTEVPPWKNASLATSDNQANLIFGESLFKEKFFDAIPLKIGFGGIEGVAYVLSHSGMAGTKRKHRVYLKGMLVSESSENLLPDWAFFVKCVIDARTLRPTASREDFYEDDELEIVRKSLGKALVQYLVDLSKHNPEKLQSLIAIHYQALKALSTENEDLLKIFFPWLPFETSQGTMTGQQLLAYDRRVYFTFTVDQFRQVSRVATAQSILVVNAGYSFDADLLERASSVFEEVFFEELDPATMSESFGELSPEELKEVGQFLKVAGEILEQFSIQIEIRKYSPFDLAALFLQNEAADFLRSVDKSKDVSNDLFSGILDGVSKGIEFNAQARLCFNYENELFHKVVQMPNGSVQNNIVQMLYIQSLLLGQYPMGKKEMALLNNGMIGLIESSIQNQSN